MEVPDEGGHIWEWFAALGRCAPIGPNGRQPIAPRDIREWCELTGTIIRPWEAEIILQMDAAWREEWAAEMEDHRARREAEAKTKPGAPHGRRRARL